MAIVWGVRGGSVQHWQNDVQRTALILHNVGGADVALHPPCPPRLLAQGFSRDAVAGEMFLLSREILIIYVQIAVKSLRAENRAVKANTK